MKYKTSIEFEIGKLLKYLTILFIYLKLTGEIEWSWLYVLMPTIIGIIVNGIILICAVFNE